MQKYTNVTKTKITYVCMDFPSICLHLCYMKDQISLLIDSLGLSPARFADEIGVQRSSISHIISGRNKPSYDFIMKILNRFPDINPEWLLTGKSAMKKSNSGLQEGEEKSRDNENNLFKSNINSGQNPTREAHGQSLHTSAQDKNDSDNIPQKEHASKRFTNVNNTDFILVFYHDGTFKRFNARE